MLYITQDTMWLQNLQTHSQETHTSFFNPLKRVYCCLCYNPFPCPVYNDINQQAGKNTCSFFFLGGGGGGGAL